MLIFVKETLTPATNTNYFSNKKETRLHKTEVKDCTTYRLFCFTTEAIR